MPNSKYLHESHNVSNLIYHFVCPAKYRRMVLSKQIEESLVQICAGIQERYEWIQFIEIGSDNDHVHFLVQSTPTHSPSEIIRVIKSITARRIFAEHPEVKKELWGGEFWTDGYFVSSVGRNANENTIANYVREQGKEDCVYQQLKLFDQV
ncbi:MAG: IS200/IS605 family transposase [Eubacteriaceae bacterium]|nr:IS200/IS605 family transposase [Eubacteriaceae bacterium]